VLLALVAVVVEREVLILVQQAVLEVVVQALLIQLEVMAHQTLVAVEAEVAMYPHCNNLLVVMVALA
jgi:hypothetical protein